MKLFTKVLATTATLALASSAMALTYTFNVASGDWNVPGNWDLNNGNVPGASDTVIIPNNTIVTVGSGVDQTASTVTIASGGKLIVSSGRTFTATNNVAVNGDLEINGGIFLTSTNAAHHVDVAVSSGKVTLTGSSPVLTLRNLDAVRFAASATSYAYLYVDSSATIDGAGSLQGRDDNNKIQINAGATLTLGSGGNATKIHGMLQMERVGASAATFQNNGKVEADVAGATILFASNLTLADSSSASIVRWSSIDPDFDGAGAPAVLQFDGAATGLAGRVSAAGVISFQNNVTTSGAASLLCDGQMLVGSGKTFQFGSIQAGENPCGYLPGSPFQLTSSTSVCSCP